MLPHRTRSCRSKILRWRCGKVKLEARLKKKMTIPCENTIKSKMRSCNGYRTILVKSGSIRTFRLPARSSTRTRPICQTGACFSRIWNGSDPRKSSRIRASSCSRRTKTGRTSTLTPSTVSSQRATSSAH